MMASLVQLPRATAGSKGGSKGGQSQGKGGAPAAGKAAGKAAGQGSGSSAGPGASGGAQGKDNSSVPAKRRWGREPWKLDSTAVRACSAKSALSFLEKMQDMAGWRWDVVVATNLSRSRPFGSRRSWLASGRMWRSCWTFPIPRRSSLRQRHGPTRRCRAFAGISRSGGAFLFLRPCLEHWTW